MLEYVTFALAYSAYLLLCGQALLHLRGRGPRWLALLLAATAVAHVALVWHGSFAWSIGRAWSGSPAACLIFHTALALIVAAALVPLRWTAWCTWLAWPIVTLGALGAVLRRAVVAQYLWPVAIACGATLACGIWLFVRPRNGEKTN
jgi:hypothetical protein